MLKRILSFCVAAVLSFFLVNGIVFLYERPVAWIDTPNGASLAIRKPNALLVHGTEGYSVSRVDENGFTNPNYTLSDQYILLMGASHSQGKELPVEKRYSAIVNAEITDHAEELEALNISCDGHFIPSIIQHFNAAVTQYPDAYCITIEIGSTDYSIESLEASLNQPKEIDLRTAEQIFAQQNWRNKLTNAVKEYVPLLSLVKSHLQTASAEESASVEYSVDAEDYREVVQAGLELIRSEYTGPIVFVYHPNTNLEQDGTVSIIRSETLDIFKDVCEDVGIDFIDVGDAFVEHYNQYHEMPYGFSNTTPGKGHLNEVGHQIMAEAILDYLGEVDCR